LWYNPGRFDQTYKKPDGSTGKTSGMQFRLDMGTSSGPSGLHGRWFRNKYNLYIL